MRYQAEYRHPGFLKISQHYAKELLCRNPVLATWSGTHQYDGLLPETGAEAVENQIAFLREMRDAFTALSENELSIDEKIDRHAMIHFANEKLFWEEDLGRWKYGRDLAMQIGESLFLLFSRDFAPVTDRVQSMIMRLRAVPVFLMASKNLFQKVPQIYGEIYLESLSSLPGFFDTLAISMEKAAPAILVREFKQVSLVAKKAIHEFSEWFRHAVMPKADASLALGAGALQAMLTIKQTGFSQNEIIDLAQKTLQDATESIENLSCLILGVATGSAAGARNEVQNRIYRKAPDNFAMAMEAYNEASKRCRSFVESSGFATLPDNEQIDIAPVPAFITHLISFSAYIPPQRNAEMQRGTYLINCSNQDNLRHHNYAEILNSVIHEVYPGHHLHLTAQNSHSGQMRTFCDDLYAIEGWARYCQKRIRELGFDSSNESYFSMANTDIFDASRMLSDINLQSGQWSIDQAIDFLISKNNISRNVARTEIKRQLMSPGNQLCGIVGEQFLRKIREDLLHKFKGDLTDKAFHDLVLYQGAIPVSTMRQYFPDLVKANLQNSRRA